MKRIKLFLAVVCLFAALPAMSQNLTPLAQRFQDKVKSHLQTEGYSPYVDEDGDLCFKVEGTLFWITLADGDDNTDPVYVEFHRSGLNIEDADRGEILQTANYINLNKKCVKASVGEKNLVFTIEMLYFNGAEFNKTIKRCINLLNSCAEAAKDYYNDL